MQRMKERGVLRRAVTWLLVLLMAVSLLPVTQAAAADETFARVRKTAAWVSGNTFDITLQDPSGNVLTTMVFNMDVPNGCFGALVGPNQWLVLGHVPNGASNPPSSNRVTLRGDMQSCIYTADDGTILFQGGEGTACGDEYLAFKEQYAGWNDYFTSVMNRTECYTVLRDVGTPFSS